MLKVGNWMVSSVQLEICQVSWNWHMSIVLAQQQMD